MSPVFECCDLPAEGKACININDCEDDPCEHGSCEDGDNDFECDCMAGYEGFRCQHNIDECASDPCQNGGTCHDMVNGYDCQCMPGYVGMFTNTKTCVCGRSQKANDSIYDLSDLIRPMFRMNYMYFKSTK